VAGAGVSHHHHNGRVVVVTAVAIQPGAVAVFEAFVLALDFLALAAAASIVPGSVSASWWVQPQQQGCAEAQCGSEAEAADSGKLLHCAAGS
jgi:hypothetical protein